jgi:hypothetical protein
MLRADLRDMKRGKATAKQKRRVEEVFGPRGSNLQLIRALGEIDPVDFE